MRIGDYTIKLSCGACPEAYDVFNLEGEYVGYLRLRHGVFRAYVEDWGVVHVSHPEGDGIFEEDERDYHLENGVIAIANYCREKHK